MSARVRAAGPAPRRIDRSLVIRGSGRVSLFLSRNRLYMGVSSRTRTHTRTRPPASARAISNIYRCTVSLITNCLRVKLVFLDRHPVIGAGALLAYWTYMGRDGEEREREKVLPLSLGLLSHAVICNFGCNLETICAPGVSCVAGIYRGARSRACVLYFFLISVGPSTRSTLFFSLALTRLRQCFMIGSYTFVLCAVITYVERERARERERERECIRDMFMWFFNLLKQHEYASARARAELINIYKCCILSIGDPLRTLLLNLAQMKYRKRERDFKQWSQ